MKKKSKLNEYVTQEMNRLIQDIGDSPENKEVISSFGHFYRILYAGKILNQKDKLAYLTLAEETSKIEKGEFLKIVYGESK